MKRYIVTEEAKNYILAAIEKSHYSEVSYDIGGEHPVSVGEMVKHVIEQDVISEHPGNPETK